MAPPKGGQLIWLDHGLICSCVLYFRFCLLALLSFSLSLLLRQRSCIGARERCLVSFDVNSEQVFRNSLSKHPRGHRVSVKCAYWQELSLALSCLIELVNWSVAGETSFFVK